MAYGMKDTTCNYVGHFCCRVRGEPDLEVSWPHGCLLLKSFVTPTKEHHTWPGPSRSPEHIQTKSEQSKSQTSKISKNSPKLFPKLPRLRWLFHCLGSPMARSSPLGPGRASALLRGRQGGRKTAGSCWEWGEWGVLSFLWNFTRWGCLRLTGLSICLVKPAFLLGGWKDFLWRVGSVGVKGGKENQKGTRVWNCFFDFWRSCLGWSLLFLKNFGKGITVLGS